MTCRRRRRLAAVCLLVLPLLALAGAQPAQARGKTLVYCSEGSPEGFNPQLFTSGTTFNASSRPLYNRLLEFEPGTTALVPGLAESWTISPDGLAYTFSLRRNVAFHTIPGFTPSRPFNADDVLFSFARQWRPEHPYHEVSGGKYTFFTSIGMGKRLKSIEKVDEHTVRFTLHQPEVPFLAELAMDFASILSSEYAYAMLKAGTPEKVDTQPVGTGPFILTAYRKDETIRYKAHPQAWQGRPRLDQLVFAITPDPSARYAKLRAGECHVAPYPNPADLPAMRENRRLRVIEQEGLDLSYLALNTEKPPLDDPRVRQAINLAVDRAAIVQAVYQGAARPARNPLPPVVWGYNNEIPPYPHDPERARQLLAEAGRGGGFVIDLWAMPVSRPYLPNGRKMAEMVQRDLDTI
ncbi:MAG: ABC transporter substrate-binding protein, partial [Rhodospirillales bacterium]|nr:ABC transporter substrate-binding protein [Rhodospirillales bacterium]